MTGQLVGTFDGRPVEIMASNNAIEIRFERLGSAWQSRKMELGSFRLPLRLLSRSSLEVTASVGRFRFAVLPRPSKAIRFLAPSLYSLLSEEKL